MQNYKSRWETSDLTQWRDAVRRFCVQEVVPHEAKWSEQGFVDRSAWLKAGELGILGADIAEEFGGTGGHFGHSAIVTEELSRVGANSFRVAIAIHVIAAHYIVAYGSDEQRENWIPRLCDGSVLAGVAMSEPGGGSDLQNIRTTAIRDGDDYVVNGSKIFITNGSKADLLVLAAKTDPSQRARGISMLLLETSRPGFAVGRRLDKIGLHSSDTCELFLNDCRIPATTLLGTEESAGFVQMMEQLAYERAIAAVGCVANMEYAFELTRQYCRDRKAFGKSLDEFQNTRFELVDIRSEAFVSRLLVDHTIEMMIEGDVGSELASTAKYLTSEKLGRCIDRCVQLFGGYGYMTEYPIARLYADARIERVYGGTTEIMKEIIARSI